jgi:hypothetical protein
MPINRREFIIVGGVGTIGGLTIGCADQSQPPSPDTGGAPQTRLTVAFKGLVAMVTPNTGTDFVMPDGDKILGAPHVPRLVAPSGSEHSSSLPHSGTTKDGDLFWDLRNYRVTLTSGETTGTTRAGGRDHATEVDKPNSTNSHRDVSWVAPMSKIPAAGTGKINPVCLADDPRPAYVSSRVRFNAGEIASRFRPQLDQVVWWFGPDGPPDPFKQALSELTIYQVIKGGQVNFQLEPFGSSLPKPKDIVLVPTTGVNLEIQITNAPPVDTGCKNSIETGTLDHFKVYYQLLETPTSTGPIPRCVGKPNCPQCLALTEVIYCPPAEFQA